MSIIKSLMVSLSTYSIIPMPNFEWSEKNMQYAMCFFPVVGIVCGVLIWLLDKFTACLNLSGFFVSAAAVCIPLIITGGIHMDGYMDTADALSSHQTKEKKLQILSDPHIGAFAVIYFGIYLILDLAFLYEIRSAGMLSAVCPVFVLSRSISALCAVNMPDARKSGMLSAYTKNAKRKAVNITMVIAAFISVIAIIRISPLTGVIAAGMGILWTFIYCRMAVKQFGGVTGDTAGFFLQLFELVCMSGILIGVKI